MPRASKLCPYKKENQNFIKECHLKFSMRYNLEQEENIIEIAF